MKELLRTNDIVLISYVEALLDEVEIAPIIADRHMSVVEGSLGVLPVRILVSDDDYMRARRVLAEAELRHALSPVKD